MPELTQGGGLPDGEHVEHHRDGSIRARGAILDGRLEGYWEWYRLDGSRMRSGHFAAGVQVGEWTTYDRAGVVVKVTTMRGGPSA